MNEEWFDSVVSEGINNREKLFKKIKKSRLPLDQENYKKVPCKVKKLIAEKKRNYFETKLMKQTKRAVENPESTWITKQSFHSNNKCSQGR